MEKKRVSVIMPVYNGAKYLNQQLDSILPMLSQDDELIISYDKSTDNTLDIIRAYEDIDSRVKVYINEGENGVWQNSMNAIKHAQGEIVIPSDQDDVWIDNKIDIIAKAFDDKKVLAVLHDGYVCDEELNILGATILEREKTTNNWLKNFLKSTVAGCCMAYRIEIARIYLDTPISPDASDQWAAICPMILGDVKIIKHILTKHRIHDSNFTPKYKRKLLTKLRGRACLACNIAWLIIHKKRFLKELS